MPTQFAVDYGIKPIHTSDHGNCTAEDYSVTTQGVVINDKVYFGLLPGGTRVQDVSVVHGAAGASATLDLGYEPVEGATPAANNTYWFATQSVATAGRANSTAQPITLERDVAIVGTCKGANFANGTVLTVIVSGKFLGAR